METIVKADEIRKIEDHVINVLGIPSLVLMEKAAMAVSDEVVKKLEADKKVLIMTGCGNNGADGLAVARILSQKNFAVTVLKTKEEHKKSREYQYQEELLCYYPVNVVTEFPVEQYDIIIDGIFGFGLNREVQGEMRKWIERANLSKGYKMAIDIPSGIGSDDGMVFGDAFYADMTITFSFLKPGLLFYPGKAYAGKVIVKEIGFPMNILELAGVNCVYETFGEKEMILPCRKMDGHKGTFGKVLVVGGFGDSPGAAMLSASAALRCGCGMILVCSEEKNRDFILKAVPEAQFVRIEEIERIWGWPDVIVIGPGMGTSKEARETVRKVLENSKSCDIVMDADALRILAVEENGIQKLLKEKKEGTVVFTPHPGELSLITRRTVSELKNPREPFTRLLAQEYHAVIVKKDACTMVISPDSSVYINTTGNNGMGSGGSGDVLSGMIAGILAQSRENSYNMVCAAVYLHGKCGDELAGKESVYSVTAGKMVDILPDVIKTTIALSGKPVCTGKKEAREAQHGIWH